MLLQLQFLGIYLAYYLSHCLTDISSKVCSTSPKQLLEASGGKNREMELQYQVSQYIFTI